VPAPFTEAECARIGIGCSPFADGRSAFRADRVRHDPRAEGSAMRIVRNVLGRLGQTQIRHVSAVPPRRAAPVVARIYREVAREFGLLAPPVALHAAAPGPLAACWLMLRETMLVTGQVRRADKEAVAAAVSRANACPFCTTIHTVTLDVLVRRDHPAENPDGLLVPPFPAGQAPELIGTAVLLHYLNRMVNVFLGDLPLPPGAPASALGPVLRVLHHLIERASRVELVPGRSLDLLPPAPLPRQLRWAAGNAPIAGAFARAAAAFEVAGTRAAPPRVRRFLAAELRTWHGQPRGPSRAWVEDAVANLPLGERPVGRLALLTAFAAHQVDRKVIEECRLDDRTLIELTSWASMAAAGHLGERVWQAAGDPGTASHRTQRR
jgi:hypothetical protein